MDNNNLVKIVLVLVIVAISVWLYQNIRINWSAITFSGAECIKEQFSNGLNKIDPNARLYDVLSCNRFGFCRTGTDDLVSILSQKSFNEQKEIATSNRNLTIGEILVYQPKDVLNNIDEFIATHKNDLENIYSSRCKTPSIVQVKRTPGIFMNQ